MYLKRIFDWEIKKYKNIKWKISGELKVCFKDLHHYSRNVPGLTQKTHLVKTAKHLVVKQTKTCVLHFSKIFEQMNNLSPLKELL